MGHFDKAPKSLFVYKYDFQIAARPDSQHFKCLFRVAFVAKDAYDLLQSDHVSFDYFYTQVCVVHYDIIMSWL